MMHSANAPLLPAVLDVAADGMAAMKFDLRGFVQELALTKAWLGSFAQTIAGGSSEVQLNVIAKRVLELPEGNSGGAGKQGK